MFMSREIMHCKPGKVKELVEKFKVLSGAMKEMGLPPVRVYTDVSGEQYWTVVVEQDVNSLDEMANIARKTMSDPKVAAAMKGYHELVNDGRRELYRAEQ
ncbi:MAG TPA: hypothetical protein VL221_02630 [Bacteroidota bacterium]|nr:hypothetical protein [Bacteroidota bacterium]